MSYRLLSPRTTQKCAGFSTQSSCIAIVAKVGRRDASWCQHSFKRSFTRGDPIAQSEGYTFTEQCYILHPTKGFQQRADLPKNNSKWVNIGRKWVILVICHCVCHIPQCSSTTGQAAAFFFSADDDSREAKVKQLDRALRVESNVRRFQITIYQSLVVQKCHGPHDTKSCNFDAFLLFSGQAGLVEEWLDPSFQGVAWWWWRWWWAPTFDTLI